MSSNDVSSNIQDISVEEVIAVCRSKRSKVLLWKHVSIFFY